MRWLRIALSTACLASLLLCDNSPMKTRYSEDIVSFLECIAAYNTECATYGRLRVTLTGPKEVTLTGNAWSAWLVMNQDLTVIWKASMKGSVIRGEGKVRFEIADSNHMEGASIHSVNPMLVSGGTSAEGSRFSCHSELTIAGGTHGGSIFAGTATAKGLVGSVRVTGGTILIYIYSAGDLTIIGGNIIGDIYKCGGIFTHAGGVLSGDISRLTPPATYYAILPGDTLWDLACLYLGDGFLWTEIQTLNEDIDPLNLPIGMTLKIPT